MPSPGLLAASFGALSLRSLPQSGGSVDWQALNTSVGGRLFKTTPLSLPCFSFYEGRPVTPNDAACSAVQTNYTNNVFRVEQFSAMMNSQDEMCPSDPSDQCLLNPSDPTDPAAFTNVTCNQGSVGDYYVAVTSAADAVAAIKFADAHKLPLSIKNSGHDFLSRNTNKGSLALWTRPLQNMSFSDAFTPKGCPDSIKYRAITSGAGVLTSEMYDFADSVNATVNGAYVGTVGGVAGWVMGGGQNILAPTLGIGADRAREFVLVTPDGEVRTANECQNQDLFWALRGGGGGTFGVVLETTVQAEGVMPLAVAAMSFNATTENVKPWLSLLVNETLAWGNQGWGGHIVGNSSLVYVNPRLSLDQAEKNMSAAAAFVQAQPGGKVVIEHLPSWQAFWSKYVAPAPPTVGKVTLSPSRLIPSRLFSTPAGRAELLAFLGDLADAGFSPYIPVATPWGYNATSRAETSTTPAWDDALWHLVFQTSWAYNSTLSDRRAAFDTVARLQRRLDAITPGGGAYMNEASPFLSDWQTQFWGRENYERLVMIKQKYDPKGLLYCHWCVVGSERPAEQYKDAVRCWEGIHEEFP